MEFKKTKQRSCLSLTQQKAILDMIAEGKKYREISKLTEVPVSTIKNVKSRRAKINAALQSGNVSKRKKVKDTKHPDVEMSLFIWFVQCRNRNVQLTDSLLKAQALKFHREICTDRECSFSASSSWVTKFKNRHNIRYLKITGEKLSADLSAIEPFKKELIEKIDLLGLTLDQVYNCDESALQFKLLPPKTLVKSDEKTASGRKTPKDRITFMPCVNVTGSNRINLQVIGKSKNPRCFKSQPPPNDVHYCLSKNAWQTRVLFKNWFNEVFVPQVTKFSLDHNLPPKALLIMDNASCHKELGAFETDDIKVLFLPPNVTSVLQPLDQNTILPIKTHYKKTLLEKIVCLTDEQIWDSGLKRLNIAEAIQILNSSYKCLESRTIFLSWKNLLLEYAPYQALYVTQSMENSFFEKNLTILAKLAKHFNESQLSVDDMVTWIQRADGFDHDFLDDDEILAIVANPEMSIETGLEETLDEEDDDSDDLHVDTSPTDQTAVPNQNIIHNFDNLLTYYEETNDMISFFTIQNLKNNFLNRILS